MTSPAELLQTFTALQVRPSIKKVRWASVHLNRVGVLCWMIYPSEAEREDHDVKLKELSAQIERVLILEGFQRERDGWVLNTPDLLWRVRCWPQRDSDVVGLYVSAYPSGYDIEQGGWLLNNYIENLVEGTSGEVTLRSEAETHPLVRDTRDVLLPLTKRLLTPEDILEGWLSGELGDPGWPRSGRIAIGFRITRVLGYPDLERQAREIVRNGSWSKEDLLLFAEQGLGSRGEDIEPVRWAWKPPSKAERKALKKARKEAAKNAPVVSGEGSSAEEYSWDGKTWSARPRKPKHWLTVELYDGDIAHVRFRHATSSGWESAWLGTLPELYFDDPSQAVEHNFAATAAAIASRTDLDTGLSADVARVEELLRAASADEPLHAFVEETVDEFMEALNLPPLPLG